MKSRKNSGKLFDRGRLVIPDGVSSPMRAFALVGGNPICAADAKGQKVIDADGNVYVDFLNAFGALILGHAHAEVVAAITRQAARGTIYGLSTELEYALAEKVVASTPEIEKIRFVCSGTEAVMTATRIARSHTGRNLIVKFGGSYHGHSDALLANPANLQNQAALKGLTQGISQHLNREVVLCEYNDQDQLARIFRENGASIAAVLVEPFATNMGFVKPQRGFLELIRELCTQHGALLIFDEVVTGFRFRFGGVCTALGIRPDLVTFGKILGGGCPIGAFGGRADLMQEVAIGGKVFQSGTFAANPLTMAAANAALDVLARPGFYAELEEKGAFFEKAVLEQFSARKIPFRFTRHGALCGIAFRNEREPMTCLRDVKSQRYDVHRAVYRGLLERGYLLAPSLEEPIFLSAAHTHQDLTAFSAALGETIQAELAQPAARQEMVSRAN